MIFPLNFILNRTSPKNFSPSQLDELTGETFTSLFWQTRLTVCRWQNEPKIPIYVFKERDLTFFFKAPLFLLPLQKSPVRVERRKYDKKNVALCGVSWCLGAVGHLLLWVLPSLTPSIMWTLTPVYNHLLWQSEACDPNVLPVVLRERWWRQLSSVTQSVGHSRPVVVEDKRATGFQ